MRASEDGAALFLRYLVPPVRLLSAAAWHLIQQEDVKHYGVLEEFVTLITDSVPDILNTTQKIQLTIGLRAKLVLELCSMEKPEDHESLQSHLQRITALIGLHKELGVRQPHSTVTNVEESGMNFVALVESLQRNPDERNIFFKDVYPLQYGVKFDTALKKLMWLFISRLENSLPQPSVEETTHMLCTAPVVMEECVKSLSHLQQLESVFKYQREDNLEVKEQSQLWSSVPDDCIFTCLGSCRVVQAFPEEQVPADTLSVSVLDYPPSYCEEVQVESVVIAQYIDNNLEMRSCVPEENCGEIEGFATVESKEFELQTATEKASEAAYEPETLGSKPLDFVVEESSEKLDTLRAEVESSKEETPVGQEEKETAKEQTMKNELEKPDLSQDSIVEQSCNILSSLGQITKDETPQKASALPGLVHSYIIKQPCVKLNRLDITDRMFSHPSNPPPTKQRRGRPRKYTQDKTGQCKNKDEKSTVTAPCSSMDKLSGPQIVVSRVIQKLKKTYTEVDGPSVFACSLCKFQDHEEIKLHHHLIVHHPEEYKQLCKFGKEKDCVEHATSAHDEESQLKPLAKMRSYRGVPVSKTCPTCGRNFTRSSDMRRHQMSHSTDRPFTCLYCGKSFRYTFDLRRHQQKACGNQDYVVLDQQKTNEMSENWSEISSASSHENVLQPSSVQSSPFNQLSPSKQDTIFCRLCRITLPNSSSLTSHMETHSKGSPHICPCGKIYKHLESMRTHQLVCPESDLHKHEQSLGDDHDAVKNSQDMLCDDSRGMPQNVSGLDESSLTTNVETLESTNSPSLAPNAISDLGETAQVTSDPVEPSNKPVVKMPPIACNSNSIIFIFDTTKQLRTPSSDQPHKYPQRGDGFRYSHELKKHEEVCKGSKEHSVPSEEHHLSSILTQPNNHQCVPTSTDSSSSLLDEVPSSNNAPQTTKMSVLTCDRCEKKFKALIALRKHKKICGGSKRHYKCVKCGLVFKTLLDVRKHVHTHWGEDPLQCPQCGKYFQSSTELAKHKVAHEREHSYPCTLCQETFYRVDSLRQHYLEIHEFKGPYQCPQCDKTHTDLGAIVSHSRTHSDDRPYQCLHCSKRFKQRSGLNMHEKLHSGDRPFLCEKCGKCFGSNIQLQRHLVCHRTDRPYVCPQCKKCFKSQQVLRVHILKHTRQASIPCEFCGKMFAQAYALHRHHRTHTGERPFGCPKCGKSFLTNGEVAKHLRFHTGERPFQCTRCPKSFTQACYLTTHMRIHTGERPYKCSLCEKAFIINTHLKRHMYVHTKEKPFKCECGKAFNRIHLLNIHRKKQCILQRD